MRAVGGATCVMLGRIARVSRLARYGPALALRWPRVQREMELVERAYGSELGRTIDRIAEWSWRLRIASGRVHGCDAVDELRTSAEYLLGRTGFYNNLHRARMHWAAGLAAFDCILDIGGSSPSDPNGALIELGYSHKPTALHILDRPEDDQFHGRPSYSQSEDRVTEWGTISFHHGLAENVTDIDALGELSFDCVFMGQTIEHIEVDKLPLVLDFVRRHLRPGGRFIFDTPNRHITRLVVGDAMLSSDHTHEYTPVESVELMRSNGFDVVGQLGLVPMPLSASSGEFHWDESETSEPVVDDPTDCFVFAFECVAVESA